MCLRRENHEIGSLLQEVKDGDAQLKKFAFLRVRSFMVFDTTSGNDAPYVHLDAAPKEKYIFPIQVWSGVNDILAGLHNCDYCAQ